MAAPPARPRLLRVVVAVAAAWLVPAVAAVAHPLGAPASALVEAVDATTVAVTWTPNPDDLVVLARHLGLEATDDAQLSEAESRSLAASAAFRAYLNEHIRLTVAAGRCEPTVEAGADGTAGNTTVRLGCPGPVTAGALEISPLLDLDTRYTTLALALGTAHDSEVLYRTGAAVHGLATDGDEVTLTEEPPAAASLDTTAPLGPSPGREARLLDLLDGTGPGAGGLLVALAIAAAVGAAHALAPGHGKAIAAAYLVGDRGRTRHAVALGLVVAAMHSVSTIVLGVVLWRARARLDLRTLSSGLQVASGLVIAAVGAFLLRRRLRERRAAPAEHRGHDHPHGHGDHGHDHVAPLTRGGLVALAATGGLLPSPTGVLVVLGSLTLGQLALGLSLVAAFSVGLAATVTATGLVALAGRDLLRARASGRIETVAVWLPVVGAAAVVAAGAIVTLAGLG